MKQNTAVDLSKRLKDFRSLNDASSLKGKKQNGNNLFVHAKTKLHMKKVFDMFVTQYSSIALEEWRKRKMERARQRDLEKTGGLSSSKTS